MNRLDKKRRAQILGCLCEGVSIRATSRLTGADKKTILRLLAQAGEACLDVRHEIPDPDIRLGRRERNGNRLGEVVPDRTTGTGGRARAGHGATAGAPATTSPWHHSRRGLGVGSGVGHAAGGVTPWCNASHAPLTLKVHPASSTRPTTTAQATIAPTPSPRLPIPVRLPPHPLERAAVSHASRRRETPGGSVATCGVPVPRIATASPGARPAAT